MSSEEVIVFRADEDLSHEVVSGLIRYVYGFPPGKPNESKYTFPIYHDHAHGRLR